MADQGTKKKPKVRARFTRETYDRILAGYRESGGNHARAAKYACVDRAMARNAYEKGFPRQYRAGSVWARPIREVLQEDLDAARLKQAELNRRQREAEDAAREAARREHVEELAEEVKTRSALRKDLMATAMVLLELVPATRALAGVVRNAVLEPDGRTPLAKPQVTPIQAMKLLREYGMTLGRVAQAGELIIQLGRTIRGESNVNVAVTDDMSVDDALAELEMAKEVLEHARSTRAGELLEIGEEDPVVNQVH